MDDPLGRILKDLRPLLCLLPKLDAMDDPLGRILKVHIQVAVNREL